MIGSNTSHNSFGIILLERILLFKTLYILGCHEVPNFKEENTVLLSSKLAADDTVTLWKAEWKVSKMNNESDISRLL